MKIMTILFFVLSMKAFAMKPAPFSDVDYKVPRTSFTVVSKQEPAKTEIKSGMILKKVLWSMPMFTGRKHIDLSSDGKLLALSGHYYWGMSHLKNDENPIVSTIYDQGKEIKAITIKDIFGKDMAALVKEMKLPEIGGGWVSGRSLITNIDIDWTVRVVTYTLADKTQKKIIF